MSWLLVVLGVAVLATLLIIAVWALQTANRLDRLMEKLADQAAGEIVLTREEAALCLGLADGVVENLEQSEA